MWRRVWDVIATGVLSEMQVFELTWRRVFATDQQALAEQTGQCIEED